jgi:hypothetical protein
MNSINQETNEHHILYTRHQIQHLGGLALHLRNMPVLRPQMYVPIHNDLHANVEPVNLLPLEHARRVFRGLEPLVIAEMDTIEAVEHLINHMAAMSLRESVSVQTNRIAQNIEANLLGQLPYLTRGIQ